MQGIIKPEEIPFWVCTTCSWRGTYSESDPVMYKTIDWQNCPSCNAVAIPDPNPLPALKDGDPVVGREHYDFDEEVREFNLIFHDYADEGILCWGAGRNKFTAGSPGSKLFIVTKFHDWRLPTRPELVKGGYPEDYYTKRGIGCDTP